MRRWTDSARCAAGGKGRGMTERRRPVQIALQWGLVALILVAVAGLGAAILSLPDEAPGLAPSVKARMASVAVSNPVTAVLLDFRGYDTLLELGVLLLAVVAVWSLGAAQPLPRPDKDSVLSQFVLTIGPLMILVAGYLFWRGSEAPGGEFQAGAVLGALGVILLLAGRDPPPRLLGWHLRAVLVAGPLVFLAVATAVMLISGTFLRYPPANAKAYMLLVELTAIFSIAVVLVSLYMGGRPLNHGENRRLDEK